jgi:HlyD family secretion protein
MFWPSLMRPELRAKGRWAALPARGGEQAAHRSQAELARLNWSETAGLRARDMVSDVELKQRNLALAGETGGFEAASGAIGEARGAIAQADAQIRLVSAIRADLHIRAPVPGRVEYRIAEPGAMMAPGGKLLSIINPEDVYLTIFVPSAAASRIRIGDEARVLPQGFTHALPARVGFVSPEAQFTPKYVETANERDNLSYRVKLQIPVEVARRYAGVLKAGMTADGFVRTDPGKEWPELGPEQGTARP